MCLSAWARVRMESAWTSGSSDYLWGVEEEKWVSRLCPGVRAILGCCTPPGDRPISDVIKSMLTLFTSYQARSRDVSHLCGKTH